MIATQRRLFRTTDPAPSATAAEEMEASGRRASQKAIVLAAVQEEPGLTASELALACRLTDVQIRKRLPDLLADGLVEQGECRQGVYRSETTWWPVNN